ncbi:HAD family hydrolase [Microlunatus sp. GCM10028923]|uniref:HAD family hydrolase n=1 Tax=Microlunatus sp. GCM10028923 TaxID=3273400 RepID=UPI003612AC03
MTIRLVAFDLDGTIYDRNGIAPECAEAIAGLAARGVHCVINSGRSIDFQLDLLTDHDLVQHFTALIGDERWVHLVDAGPVLRALEPWNTEVRSSWTELEPIAEGWCRRLEEQTRQRNWNSRISDPETGHRRGIWAISVETPERAQALAEWLQPQLAGSTLACNSNGTIVHIYDAARDKGTSLAALAGQLGLRHDEVLAFGDGYNDQPMLDGRHGFASATVANANDEVKGWVRQAGGRIAGLDCGLGVAELLTEVFPPTPART